MNTRTSIFFCTFIGLSFFVFAYTILHIGHLHEDAYILFQYSKKLADGKGIVFDETSGRAEGATDFLWMITLSGLHRLGMDLGAAAAALNAAGLSAICYTILKIRGRIDAISLSAILLASMSGGLAAALGGFSTLAYGGLFSCFILSGIEKRFTTFGYLVLVIPLFRPDGAILVLGGVLTMLSVTKNHERRRLLLAITPALVLGPLYFFWRYFYFDLILPLPLLVKSKTDSNLEGLGVNCAALWSHLILLSPLAATSWLGWKKGTFCNLPWRDILLAGTGSLLLIIALSYAHQSQNIGYRFQFPAILSIILMYVISTRDMIGRSQLVALVAALGIATGFNHVRTSAMYLTNDDYINSFPQMLRKHKFNVDSIALTEAGRFPFWFDAPRMLDLVGLNSATIFKVGQSQAINEAKPKLIFLHHAGTFDTQMLDTQLAFIEINSNQFKLKTIYKGQNPVLTAPAIALDYAQKNNFEAILVKYGKLDNAFSHVYFLSPELNRKTFLLALKESLVKTPSHIESIKQFGNQKNDVILGQD